MAKGATESFQCEACGVSFEPHEGGVCAQCKRVLCAAHLCPMPRRRTPVGEYAEPLCRECAHPRAGVS